MRTLTMESSENRNALNPPASTKLRLPTTHAATATATAPTGLKEISDSQSNARAQMSSIPTKRAANDSGVAPPDAKRKTLAERAGEPIQPRSQLPAPTPTSAFLTGTISGSSIVQLANARNANKTTTTALPRANSVTGHRPTYSSTNPSNFAKSLGPSSRPPVTGLRQPSFTQSTNRSRSISKPRPATSMSSREPSNDISVAPTQPPNGIDVDERLNEVDAEWKVMKEAFNISLQDKKAMETAVQMAKSQVDTLEAERQKLNERNELLQKEMDALRQQFQQLTLTLERQKMDHEYQLQNKSREHEHEVQELQRKLRDESDRLQRINREEKDAFERQCRADLEGEKAKAAKEVQELRLKLGAEQQDINKTLLERERELRQLQSQLDDLRSELSQEQRSKRALQEQISEMATTNGKLEARNQGLRAQIDFLESDSKQQSDSFAQMEARLREALEIAENAKQKLIKEETERRILFNKYQELKGNIRVMCRVRPALTKTEGNEAKIMFPDAKTSSAQIEVTGLEEKSSFGNINRKVLPFEFDRVFAPSVHNEEIFDEISQLVQSALDGYNVCIFCYGQTGSGKTYTMSSPDGMIPRATHMIYDTITKLREKSWTYTMEGSFVEVYNEELHDLLDGNNNSKRKLEIRHDDVRKQTTVLNCKTVALDSADKVEMMLKQAQNNRSVASTKANERSSRSHSVFILKLVGENSVTNERCEGTLNLVDLAGSERLKHSQAEGERMKETQNINKSLACLGDVIEALGRGSSHVPYRNSKLTHLLQYSLGGNSKTLMFVMVSPLEAHLKETITSLRFATKVHNTHIGTAKSTKKTIKDRSDRSSEA
ncbi:P-loop containing nucleoside triphosphate hydrolase protein [Pseudoneurospora amorphoporcata]|uniref:Kinesin-like protein n=1 Tax=Pseudoneurospora amorphoporcata TaxID=241081 RepID=A0AAN6NU83_9PEZI|nr:P-loop containing nucleoside triphosphate hydrolase protein [Pseudoneurospora amorphoporcata]